jgi:hypothetical protein
MAKGISKKNLGLGLLIALVIQYVFPMVKLGSLSWIGTLIILVIGLYLLFF